MSENVRARVGFSREEYRLVVRALRIAAKHSNGEQEASFDELRGEMAAWKEYRFDQAERRAMGLPSQ